MQFILTDSNFYQSSIPRNAGPFLGTTKKLHDCSAFLCLIGILHTLNCGILEFLCAYHCMCMYLFTSVIGILGKSILNMLLSIRLPSMPASILKFNSGFVWLLLAQNLGMRYRSNAMELKVFVLTASNSQSVASQSCCVSCTAFCFVSLLGFHLGYSFWWGSCRLSGNVWSSCILHIFSHRPDIFLLMHHPTVLISFGELLPS